METEENKSFLQKLKEHKKLIFTIGILFLFAFILVFLFIYASKKTKPKISTPENKLDVPFVLKETPNTRYVSFYKLDKGYIYKSNKQGNDAVYDFINTNIAYNGSKKVIPDNFISNSLLIRKVDDSTDLYLQTRGVRLLNQHYTFQQKIQGIPVYGSSLLVHLRNKNEIYAVTASLISDSSLPKENLIKDQAEKIALQQAKKEAKNSNLKIEKTEKSIFNRALLGESTYDTNHIVFVVSINSTSGPVFSKNYIVDATTGDVIYTLNLIIDVLQREVGVCGVGVACDIKRKEGEAASGLQDIDNTYDFLGEIYKYYFKTYSRDSFDNKGATQIGNINGQNSCQNAYWLTGEGKMSICPGMAALDVVGHEFTHGVVEHSSALGSGSGQSSALNEAIADIFGSALDNNWTIGENTVKGVFRNMKDPAELGDPDRLYSKYYACNEEPHKNAGVINKSFYLMAEGGSFNGCTVSGIGKEKARTIVYITFTRYLFSTANFKNMYVSLLAACNDLETVETCNKVKTALQSTELDQQPDNEQNGALCLNIDHKTPSCASGSPTGVPTTAPSVTPGPSPTPISSCGDASLNPANGKCVLLYSTPLSGSSCGQENKVYQCGLVECLWTTTCGDKQGICSHNNDGYSCDTYCQDLANKYGGSKKAEYKSDCLTNHCSDVSCSSNQVCDIDHSCVTQINLGTTTTPATPTPSSITPTSSVTPTVAPTGTKTAQKVYTCEFSESESGNNQLQIKTLVCNPK